MQNNTYPKQNQLKSSIENGETVFGIAPMGDTPREVEIFGQLGMDWIWIDLEHINGSPYDSTWLENLVRAAECAGTEIMVRVPSHDPSMIRKVVDTGVQNFMIPRITSADKLESAVQAAYFAGPFGEDGTRGISSSRVTGWGASNFSYDKSDENMFVGAIIEEELAIENIDEILTVPGIDFASFGPYCTAASMGFPGDHNNERVVEAENLYMDAIEKHNIHNLMMMNIDYNTIEGGGEEGFGKYASYSTDEIKSLIDRGHNMLQFSYAREIMRGVLAERLEDLSEYND